MTQKQAKDTDGGGEHEPWEFHFEDDPFLDNPTLRITGLAARAGRLLAKASRYLAFTSDVGEAFRPVAHPRIVQAGYAVSIAYVLGDIGFTVKRAKDNNGDYVRAGSQAALFQFLGSLLLPALVVHTVVHQSEKVFHKFAKPGTNAMRFGPVGLGLAVIPFLPIFVDEPVEHAVEAIFHKFWPVKEEAEKKE